MDKRSKRIVYVSHCILNTNIIAQGLGTVNRFPSMIAPVVKLLFESNVGIIQMPCPEKDVLGLVRKPCDKDEMPEKVRKNVIIVAKSICREIEIYLKNGFKVLAIIGKRGSPTCGVKECWVSKKLSQEPGFFMEELMKQLKKKNISIPFIDFEKEEEMASIKAIRKLL